MALPKELEGKTPQEIAEFYQGKIDEQKGFYENAIANLDAGNEPSLRKADPPKGPSVGEFMADPSGETQKLINQHSVSKTEWESATAMARDNFIYLAKQRAMETLRAEAETNGDTFDWDRVAPLLEKVTKTMDPLTLTNPLSWTTAYYYNRGMILNQLRKEAVDKALLPAESSTPGGGQTPLPKELSSEEETVAVGFGISAESYRQAQKDMRVTKLPLTMDNRGGRR